MCNYKIEMNYRDDEYIFNIIFNSSHLIVEYTKMVAWIISHIGPPSDNVWKVYTDSDNICIVKIFFKNEEDAIQFKMKWG